MIVNVAVPLLAEQAPVTVKFAGGAGGGGGAAFTQADISTVVVRAGSFGVANV